MNKIQNIHQKKSIMNECKHKIYQCQTCQKMQTIHKNNWRFITMVGFEPTTFDNTFNTLPIELHGIQI